MARKGHSNRNPGVILKGQRSRTVNEIQHVERDEGVFEVNDAKGKSFCGKTGAKLWGELQLVF